MLKVHASSRRYSGQDDAERILRFLNDSAKGTAEGRDRLANLWEQLVVLDTQIGGPTRRHSIFLPSGRGFYADLKSTTEDQINDSLGELGLEPEFGATAASVEIIWR